jgi:hypothetical protein
MKLITDEIKQKLLENGARFMKDENFDPDPVVKLFKPDGAATWLISIMYPDDHDILFGLCDLGLGYPELGDVSLSELESAHGGRLGMPVERDLHFKADKSMAEYARLATAEQGIRA